MDIRNAYEITMEHMLEYLDDEGMHVSSNVEKTKEGVKKMVNDPQFIEEFAEFLQDHLADFGENYGL
ncbi:hypothetical protein [Oceanobacillus profundus]|uniref:Uncharacterized protein n=1 Tax=Oceanobacillus profundus TaxID=372463 RepID=A0A417YGF5_9BACI|nr:hypothetical protein [Oceanobacillus profundus]RHW31891.1 hypothetical protein D1B32_11675 [Oceanobacillus profundus]